MNRVRVAVVGAGPYGLAVAAHLGADGTPYRIFGTAMKSWLRHMPDGMFLKSEGFASNIGDPHASFTLGRFCRESGRAYADLGSPVPLDTFSAYGLWFQQNAVPELEDVDVTLVRRINGAFALELSSGETVEADRVVVASGLGDFRAVPRELRELEPDLASHTFQHRTFRDYRGKVVAVVGAGQSALETAALLHESGAVPRILARAAAIQWNPPPREPRPVKERLRAPRSDLGSNWKQWTYLRFLGLFRYLPENRRVSLVRTSLGPAGGWWLRDRVEEKVAINLRCTLREAVRDGARARLTVASDGQTETLHFDHVFAGTGFRVDVDRILFLPQDMRGEIRRIGGAPRLTAHFESSVRGLYFVGLPAAHTFGPAMRFVCGSGFAAGRVAEHVR